MQLFEACGASRHVVASDRSSGAIAWTGHGEGQISRPISPAPQFGLLLVDSQVGAVAQPGAGVSVNPTPGGGL